MPATTMNDMRDAEVARERQVDDHIRAGIGAFEAHTKETAHTRDMLEKARQATHDEIDRLTNALQEINRRLEVLPTYDVPTHNVNSVGPDIGRHIGLRQSR